METISSLSSTLQLENVANKWQELCEEESVILKCMREPDTEEEHQSLNQTTDTDEEHQFSNQKKSDDSAELNLDTTRSPTQSKISLAMTVFNKSLTVAQEKKHITDVELPSCKNQTCLCDLR